MADLDRVIGKVEAELVAQSSAPDPLGRGGSLDGVQLIENLVRRLLELWVQGGTTDSTDIETARRAGARAAQGGPSLELLVKAWRLTPPSLIGMAHSDTEDRLAPLDVLDLAHLMLDSTDQLVEVFKANYRAEQLRLAGGSQAVRNQLLQEIFTGQYDSPTLIKALSDGAGLQLPASLVVFAIVVDQATMQAPTEADLDDLQHHGGCGVVAQRVLNANRPGSGGSRSLAETATTAGVGAVLASEETTTGLTALITQRRWYAASANVTSWGTCWRAFKQARRALAGPPHWAFVNSRVLNDADVQVLSHLHEPRPDHSASLVQAVLGPLLDLDHETTLATVEAYLAEGSAPLAARRLGVHPQTVRRRLNHAQDLTGRSLQSSWDRFVLDLATTLAPQRPDPLASLRPTARPTGC